MSQSDPAAQENAAPRLAAALPPEGTPREKVLDELRAMRAQDADWRSGRTWSLVYNNGDEHTALLREAYGMFFHENALNPGAFPSLRRMETEVLAMAAGMLGGGPGTCGSMTSGGSESLLMAVKTYRDLARTRRPEVERPEMLLPASAHPALLKAAHYFGVRPVLIPLDSGFRADAPAAKRLITRDTILMVGSAPAYPHGVLDPIPELSALALERAIPFHVDACLGGFLLPWARRLGREFPAFDLRLPGVTSISADVHKYGFGAKGASVVLYRDADIHRHQFFVYPDWCGGLYASPTMTGTRAGGPIAAAWACMRAMGEAGYLRAVETILRASDALRAGIASVPGLRLLGAPDLSVFAFASDRADCFALGDAMDARGWRLDRQQRPDSLHMMVTPAHAAVVEPFLKDLRECAAAVAADPSAASKGTAPMYGAAARLPDRGAIRESLIGHLAGISRLT